MGDGPAANRVADRVGLQFHIKRLKTVSAAQRSDWRTVLDQQHRAHTADNDAQLPGELEGRFHRPFLVGDGDFTG